MSKQTQSQVWKVHRRSVTLDGRDHTVFSLRPRDKIGFASNSCHGAWHVVTDTGGAQLLGRLCWALAYQKKPGTFLLIDGPHLRPNPFDGDPSWPIVIANICLGAPSRRGLRQLKALLPWRTPSEGTVKLTSFGLDRDNPDRHWNWRAEQAADRAAVADQVGVVYLAGRSDVLRSWARQMVRLDVRSGRWGTDYIPVADWDGEVQIFRGFYDMVQDTAVVRRARFPGRDKAMLDPGERDVIYHVRDTQDRERWSWGSP